MDALLMIALLAIPTGAFAAGVFFHRYVLSEAESIMQHIDQAETRIRAEIAGSLRDTAQKIS